MKKWTLIMTLLALFVGVDAYAQDNVVELKFKELISKITTEKSILERTEIFVDHSSLLRALKAAELDKVLDYKGEFTVFAPSNSAFEKLSKVTLDKLFDPENIKSLKRVLSYHIIADKLSASKILKAMCRGNGKAEFTTILGDKITATMNGIDIVLSDTSGNRSTITTADSNQSNGIIHEVDTVLISEKFF